MELLRVDFIREERLESYSPRISIDHFVLGFRISLKARSKKGAADARTGKEAFFSPSHRLLLRQNERILHIERHPVTTLFSSLPTSCLPINMPSTSKTQPHHCPSFCCSSHQFIVYLPNFCIHPRIPIQHNK